MSALQRIAARDQLPTHCEQCGRLLDQVQVQDGYRSRGGEPKYELHLRCPKKVRSSLAAAIFGDWHDETVVPDGWGMTYPRGDPGPILYEVKWR